MNILVKLAFSFFVPSPRVAPRHRLEQTGSDGRPLDGGLDSVASLPLSPNPNAPIEGIQGPRLVSHWVVLSDSRRLFWTLST